MVMLIAEDILKDIESCAGGTTSVAPESYTQFFNLLIFLKYKLGGLAHGVSVLMSSCGKLLPSHMFDSSVISISWATPADLRVAT